MRLTAIVAAGLALMLAAGCGGAPGGGATPRSRQAARAEPAKPKADYHDENSVGMSNRRVRRWRWNGARKDCFYVVGNRCFTTERAACKAAGCSDECATDDSAPVQVTCSRR